MSGKTVSFSNGLTADEITAAFTKAVKDVLAEKKRKGVPIAKYDPFLKAAYLEMPDGTREYIH